jgi:amino acid transporter
MITMAVFGAIVMYIMSMLSLFKLRKTEPNLERTFRAPGYPIVPGIALVLAVVCLVAMAWFNADRPDFPRLHGSRFRLLRPDRAVACRCTGGCDVDRAIR